jgi:hypothetical protein
MSRSIAVGRDHLATLEGDQTAKGDDVDRVSKFLFLKS